MLVLMGKVELPVWEAWWNKACLSSTVVSVQKVLAPSCSMFHYYTALSKMLIREVDS